MVLLCVRKHIYVSAVIASEQESKKNIIHPKKSIRIICFYFLQHVKGRGWYIIHIYEKKTCAFTAQKINRSCREKFFFIPISCCCVYLCWCVFTCTRFTQLHRRGFFFNETVYWTRKRVEIFFLCKVGSFVPFLGLLYIGLFLWLKRLYSFYMFPLLWWSGWCTIFRGEPSGNPSV